MNEKRGLKIPIALLGAGGLTAFAFWAASRKPEPTPPADESGATVQIEVHDALGNIVPHNSPVELEEGASYTFT